MDASTSRTVSKLSRMAISFGRYAYSSSKGTYPPVSRAYWVCTYARFSSVGSEKNARARA